MKLKQIIWLLAILLLAKSTDGLFFQRGGSASSGLTSSGSGQLLRNVVTTLAGSPGKEGEDAPYEAYDQPIIAPGGLPQVYGPPSLPVHQKVVSVPQVYGPPSLPIHQKVVSVPVRVQTTQLHGNSVSTGGKNTRSKPDIEAVLK